MARTANFDKKTKRQALERSGGKCEAAGTIYGLEEGQRCNAPLSFGVEFDHWDLEANSKDKSLANCVASCPRCHKFKTAKHDIPKAAKTLRQQDKNRGVKRSKQTIKSRGFQPGKQRSPKETLPPRPLFERAE